jgi:hypothetical protein
VREPGLGGFADQSNDLVVGVPEPACRGGVGRVTGFEHLLEPRLTPAAHRAQQLYCLLPRQRVLDVAEVDCADELLRLQVHEQAEQRFALALSPQIPDGIDDRAGSEMDDPLLRSKPAQLILRRQASPETAHVGRDVVELPADDEVLESAHCRDDDLRATAVCER